MLDNTVFEDVGSETILKKINVFIFAAHHSSGNIASLRFKGLVKYLDKERFRVFIFTRHAVPAVDLFELSAGVEVLSFSGGCVGTGSSRFGSLFVLFSALFPSAPSIAGALRSRVSSLWIVNALRAANALCKKALEEQEACVVVGTYSPLDALVAARCLSTRYALPCVQDFRDGLTFEALGKLGKVRGLIKELAEQMIVRSSTLVTSVSRALVENFSQKYPFRKVCLLPNGYDPTDYLVFSSEDSNKAAQIIATKVDQRKFLIGHFGRIGASDASSIPTLRFLVSAVNANSKMRDGAHLLLVGQLTSIEIDILKNLRCSYSVVDTVERKTALQLMMRCDALLLVTGDRVSCATGKIFEYLAAKRFIVCFSAVSNEASRIISETRTGTTILVSSVDQVQSQLDDLFSVHPVHALENITCYSKATQAETFGQWLTEMVV